MSVNIFLIFILSVISTFFIVKLIIPFHSSSPSPPPPPPPSCKYKIVHDWKGTDLIPENNQGWEYFTSGDPTHGSVKYGAYPELMKDLGDGKLRIDIGNVINNTVRKSIRINTKETFDDGLFIFSADHIPEGFGVWPAWWLTGQGATWACHGEIDLVEGVNSVDEKSSINAVTLHTNTPVGGKPCNQSGVPGISQGGNCEASGKKDSTCGCDGKSICPYTGCGVHMKANTFGWGFNKNGGGTFACELSSGGQVKAWFFPVDKIPCDILSNKPDPGKWNKDNYIEFNPCPKQFQKLKMIINTTLCGDWAGGVLPDCQKKILDWNNVKNGYWIINFLKIFKHN